MKGLTPVYLHPDNLQVGKRYKVKFRGTVNPNLEEIREGKFIKLSLVYTDEKPGRKLAAQFQFAGDGIPRAITWGRIASIELLSRKRKEEE